MGVTGVRSEINTNLDTVVNKIKSVSEVPACVGFGINTPDQAKRISVFADGVIVGSAIIKIIARLGDNAGDEIYSYVKDMKDAANASC